jgi:FkbM family methyltransferase
MYSQYNEDRIIRDFFKDYVGTFLDIGASDGSSGSNTRALALRGWSGWCVEPNPFDFGTLFKLYEHSKVKLVNAALAREPRWLEFFPAGQLSTASVETIKLAHMNPLFSGKFWIPAVSPAQLVTIVSPDLDFVSLDCEAMDLEIAKAAGHLLSKTKLICYEHTLPGVAQDDAYTTELQSVFESYGFTNVVGRTTGNVLISRPA